MAITTLVSGALPQLTPLPKLTPVYDARTGSLVPNQTDPTTLATKTFLQQQLSALPQTYSAQKLSAAALAKQGLAGYGGYSIDAQGNLTYDPSQAGTGQLERQAVQGQRSSANASGMLYSSFTDTGIAQALGRLSQTAQGVVNQYAGQLAGYLNDFSTQSSNLYGQWAGLLGQDAQFQLDHPPTGTVAPPPVDVSVNTPGAANQIAATVGLPASGPTYSGALAQRYGGIYGSAGSDPTQQQNVITSWLRSHYSPTISATLIKRALSDPSYASGIYTRAVGGTVR